VETDIVLHLKAKLFAKTLKGLQSVCGFVCVYCVLKYEMSMNAYIQNLVR